MLIERWRNYSKKTHDAAAGRLITLNYQTDDMHRVIGEPLIFMEPQKGL